MNLSAICRKCHAPEVVHAAWHSICLNCLDKVEYPPEDTTPDVDPGVTRPVRPGHSLISSASAEHYLPAPEPEPEVVLPTPEELARHEEVPHIPAPDEPDSDAPDSPPPSEASDGEA